VVFEITDTAGPVGTEQDGDLDLIPANFGDRVLALRRARRQLEAIQGTFVLENIGPGARVRITVPSGPVRDTPEPPAGLGRPILVVEDSDRAFQLIEVFAKPNGYYCSRATNGIEGVAKVKTGRYEAVIMDVRMPLMDGYAATRAIREWERESGRPPIPILLVSADDELRQLQMGRRAGCSAFLQKPITKTQLLSTLKMHLPVEVSYG
jgi:CheY-like chemotaxis protein